MEIYTTSFTYPRRSRLAHSPASSLDFSSHELRPQDSYSQLHQQHVNSTLPDAQGTASPSDYDAVQKVAMMAMAIYGVQISFAPADQGRAWNFQISGVYQQVMLARGMIMKECPVQVRNILILVLEPLADDLTPAHSRIAPSLKWCVQTSSIRHRPSPV